MFILAPAAVLRTPVITMVLGLKTFCPALFWVVWDFRTVDSFGARSGDGGGGLLGGLTASKCGRCGCGGGGGGPPNKLILAHCLTPPGKRVMGLAPPSWGP